MMSLKHTPTRSMGRTLRVGTVLLLITLVSGHFVINTWSGAFEVATETAYAKLLAGGSAVDAVEAGCSACERQQCDTSVGYGNHPDSHGHTSLDALIMDGDTFDAGSVAYLRGYRDAISIARAVMQYTSHTLLVGEGAEQFAKMAGFPALSASDNNTVNEFEAWVGASCQPNYFTGVAEAEVACGPYHLGDEGGRREVDGGEMESGGAVRRVAVQPQWADSSNHDTIGMVAISNPPSPSSPPSMACGTSTNGADHKIAGRVGDSPITGAGCYVDSDIGGAAATGDGDIMMRFLPAFHAVSLMAVLGPEAACRAALARIAAVFPSFQGGLVCVSRDGRHGAAAHNMGFSYSFADASGVQVVTVA